MKFYLILIIFCISFILAQEEEMKKLSPATEKEFIEDIDRYVDMLKSKNSLVSLNSLDYILNYFGEKATPALIRGLSHPNHQVRCFSAVAISKFPDKKAIKPLIALIKDTNGIDFQVLSDDGLSIHSSYGGPLNNAVRENALRTLQSITGINLGDWADPLLSQKWEAWWEKEEKTFSIIKPEIFSNTYSEMINYPIPDYARLLE